MATNLSLNTRTPNKNGSVGFASIETFGATPPEDLNTLSNSQRVNSLFNHRKRFSRLNDANISLRMFDGKFGLSGSEDVLINESRLERIDSEIALLESSDDPNATASLDRLRKEKTLVEKIQIGVAELFNRQLDSSGEIEEDFNPDFPAGSVSFGYNKTLDRSAEDLEGIPTARSPNIAHPVGGFAHGLIGGGGFGNDKNEKSIADGLIDSVQFAGKYIQQQ